MITQRLLRRNGVAGVAIAIVLVVVVWKTTTSNPDIVSGSEIVVHANDDAVVLAKHRVLQREAADALAALRRNRPVPRRHSLPSADPQRPPAPPSPPVPDLPQAEAPSKATEPVHKAADPLVHAPKDGGDAPHIVQTVMHKLNRHLFTDVCGSKVELAKAAKRFPDFPISRDTITSFESIWNGDKYLQRVFGFIHPPKSGEYHFAVASDDQSELWLSTDESPANIVKIAYLGTLESGEGEVWTQKHEWTKYPTQRSRGITLEAGKRYFIDSFHKQMGGGEEFAVAWSIPGTDTFNVIGTEYISCILEEATTSGDVVRLLQGVPSHEHKKPPSVPLVDIPEDPREHTHKIPLVPEEDTKGVLNECKAYNPSYIVKTRLPMYRGVTLVFDSSVYPDDYTGKLIKFEKGKRVFNDGNPLLSKAKAEEIANSYMSALNGKRSSDPYNLVSIANVEEKWDKTKKSGRYLVELLVRKSSAPKDSKPLMLSEYVFKSSTEFCHPPGFNWDKHAKVYIVIPVKNQGKWLQHFIDDVAEIYANTQDSHLRVVIVDYESTDINARAALQKSGLPTSSWTLVEKTGKFERAGGVQAGVNAIPEDNAIVFACDLHLEIPDRMIDYIRKHTVRGKTAFGPEVIRLDCDATPEVPFGYWETAGYGLFAMYKDDWNRIGGMNIHQFKDKWGGEDWEMVDRVYSNGFELERFRVPQFYHYFHSHKGMWGDKKGLFEKKN